MKVTDLITITELSRIMNKSRPTIYKYISDFEEERYNEIPAVVLELFKSITSNTFSKKDIYSYCDSNFTGFDELNEIFTLIKENRTRINLKKLKEYIEKEIL